MHPPSSKLYTNFGFCEEKILTLKKHIDLQSHAFYDDKNNSKNNSNNINVLEDNTNGVQVDDIEKVNV